MRIVLAEKIGFCFGVKRAVNMAEAALKNKKPIFSIGSIIHNRQVVEDLSGKGLKVTRTIPETSTGMVVISSHGLSPKIAKEISDKGLKIIDTTCPFVLNAQRITRRLSREGYKVVIVGDAKHPEVKALVDFAEKNVFVVKDRTQASRLKIRRGEKVSMLSQTTQSMGNFLDVVKVIAEKKPKELRVFNTICRDAQDRQDAASALARDVDVMLTVGGKDSANTGRLFEVCKKALKDSYLIEGEDELRPDWLKRRQTVGITSGASTPDWVVRRVVDRIKSKVKSKKAKPKVKSQKF